MQRCMRACVGVLVTLLCMLFCGCVCESSPHRTLFVYLCGSNLESKQGHASHNLDEMLAAGVPENVEVVLQTGGAATWHTQGVSNDHPQRYVVRDGRLVLVEDLEESSMGEATTLHEFLQWGAQNYWGEHNMLLLWGHGSTTGDGICYDEIADDWLDRSELDLALRAAELPAKLDYVLLDTCFGSNVDNALMLAPYAQRMVAVEGLAPARGLDYVELVNDFSRMEAHELGQAICDAYLQKCREYGEQSKTLVALMDLAFVQNLRESLENYFNCLETLRQEDARVGAQFSGAAATCTLYDEGSKTWLCDLRRLLDATAAFDGADPVAVKEALDSLVAYLAAEADSSNAGISLFCPKDPPADTIGDFSAISSYAESCAIKSYGSFLEGAYGDAKYYGHRLADEGSLDEDGNLSIALPLSADAWVRSIVCEVDRPCEDESSTYVPLGETAAIRRTQVEGGIRYAFVFEGTWPAIAGTPLWTRIYQQSTTRATYTSPVRANDVYRNILITYDLGDPGKGPLSCSLWDGYDKWGAPGEGFQGIQPSDRLAACAVYNNMGLIDRSGTGDAVEAGEGVGAVQTMELPDGRYRCRFAVVDITGRIHGSKFAFYDLVNGKVAHVELSDEQISDSERYAV